VIGGSYLRRGRPVTVLVRWEPRGGPGNVLTRRPGGDLAVRLVRSPRKPAMRHAAPAQPPKKPGARGGSGGR